MHRVTKENKLLRRCGAFDLGPSCELALNSFRDLCNFDPIDLCRGVPAPPFMKNLATVYFDMVEKKLVSCYNPSAREKAILISNRLAHSLDFLKTIPFEGLGQTIHPRQFRCVLHYRLAIPIYPVDFTCPCCSSKIMDCFGDHVVHCDNDIGLKFRHNLVRDVLADICTQARVFVQKEVPLGFLSEEGRDLRPADLLVYGWDKGKNVCLDVMGVSPFTGAGVDAFVPGAAVSNAVARKKKKYESKCIDNGYSFISFAFSTFGELGSNALEFLSRVTRAPQSNATNANIRSFIFQRLCFAVNKGVGAQLVARLPSNFV